MKLKNNCLRTGAYILIDSLIQNGVEHIFGYPGGAILPIYDELYHWEKAKLIKHITNNNQYRLMMMLAVGQGQMLSRRETPHVKVAGGGIITCT